MVTNENWFDDSGIIEQEAVICRTTKGETVGISLITDGSEIILEKSQLEDALDYSKKMGSFEGKSDGITDDELKQMLIKIAKSDLEEGASIYNHPCSVAIRRIEELGK